MGRVAQRAGMQLHLPWLSLGKIQLPEPTPSWASLSQDQSHLLAGSKAKEGHLS